MKKTLLVAIVMIIVCGLSFASDDFLKCSSLIDKKLDSSTVSLIQKYSPSLSEMEKYNLYESNKSNTTVPFLCNLFLGIGIGSYIQGDDAGGTTCLLSELSTAVLFYYNYAKGIRATTQAELESASIGTTVWGLAFLAVRVVECIRPFTYAKQYNKRFSYCCDNPYSH